MSELPRKSLELDGVQHQEIISLFARIDLARHDDTGSYHVFDGKDYRELLTVYGYNQLEVGADEEKRLNLRLKHAPSDGLQCTDLYVYNPEQRALKVERVTQNYTNGLEKQYEQLLQAGSQSEELLTERAFSYMRIVEGLRGVMESSSDIAAVFERYYMEEQRVSSERKVEHDNDRLHILEFAALENEVTLIDLMESLPSCESLLESYRETLSRIALLDVQINLTLNAVREAENKQVKTEQLYDSAEFIRLLRILDQVESNNT
jgi:hypothetical protein